MDKNSFTHLLESVREVSEIMYVSTLHWQVEEPYKCFPLLKGQKYKTKRITEEKLIFLFVILGLVS